MKKGTQVLYWAPRVIGILAILFVSMFALDSFTPDLTVGQQIGGFLIHLIPSFALLAILLVAWKWELIGGIIFTAIGVVFTPVIFAHNYEMNHSIGWSSFIVLVITMPFVLAGILFMLSHFKRKRQNVE